MPLTTQGYGLASVPASCTEVPHVMRSSVTVAPLRLLGADKWTSASECQRDLDSHMEDALAFLVH